MRAILPVFVLASLTAFALAAPLASAASPSITLTADEKDEDCPKTFCFQASGATSIAAGDSVTVTMVNPSGNGPHNVCVQWPGYAQKCAPGDTQFVSGGNSTTLNFTAPASGTVEYWCNVPGHKTLGMDGTWAVQSAMTDKTGDTGMTDTGKKSPGVGLVAIALGVGLLAVALRRR
jgi:plastocyanin